MRDFRLTLPIASTKYNLYTLMSAAPNAIPVDGILQDRVQQVLIQSDGANVDKIRVGDSNVSAIHGTEVLVGDSLNFGPVPRNSIDLKSFYLLSLADGGVVNVTINSR